MWKYQYNWIIALLYILFKNHLHYSQDVRNFLSVQNWTIHAEKWEPHLGKPVLWRVSNINCANINCPEVSLRFTRKLSKDLCFNCHNFADNSTGINIINVVLKNKGFKGCNTANEQFNLEERCAWVGRRKGSVGRKAGGWGQLRSQPVFNTRLLLRGNKGEKMYSQNYSFSSRLYLMLSL